ncbi:uncharacterized protein Z518_03623 [Rhinocladiella mackenziei CBS 650.93]|uniref:beta-glucosidase n=1 Tax=Rhinocladiella mackenziei CBS 650.93 TaxID=1442369 RepID=A0A0D2IR60_9EURO|nr:uncharacterized protein Z518_03623 [Rhinocladiella mackenziei CBS 650.93]KIX05651.1 hypothetical protein Z518_03623 [Rhinocladiella mackenziei CBS 650.93]
MAGLFLSLFALGISTALSAVLSPRQGSSAWRDKSLPAAQRADDLLPQLSWEEKIGQMGGIRQLLQPNATFNRTTWNTLYPLQHGILSYGSQLNQAQDVLPYANMVREEQLNSSKVPWISVTDSVNSIYVPGGTIFPATLSLSTSWNLSMYEQVVAAIRDENMALGTHWVLSPELDIAKEPRNGRVGEMYGEDVYLIGEFAAQYVRTMQGRDENGYIKVGTTIKHFLYGQGMGGVNTASMHGGVNHLYNDLAIPYIRVLKENPTAVMISYSSIDRTPMSTNTALIQGMLRSEMGFRGLIMSDAMGILHLYTESKVASSYKDAAVKALRAGLQLELAPGQPACFPFLVNSSNDQEIVNLVDEAVRQHLVIKFETGMFDLPLPTPENLNRTLRAPQHLEINRQASRDAIVLLSNDGFLPQANLTKIALIGPFGDILDPGSYAPSTAANPLHGQTLKDSLEVRFGSANIQYVKGVDIRSTSTNDTTGIEDAVAAAKNAGVAIVALGSLSVYFLDPITGQRTDGEFFSHASLGFPGSQQQLLDAVLDTGVPTILVLNGGQAFVLNNSTMRANAILHQFLGGEFSADALVEIITGQVNPSGKLTISMPQAEGAFPIYYDYLPSDNVGGAGGFNGCAGDWSYPCLDRDGAPMAFGYGLSYTTFDISEPQVLNSSGVSISCTVANTGDVVGKEVVQVYFRQQYSDIELPNKRLIRFEKIELQPGEARKVEFTIDKNDLGYYNNAKYQVDSGNYTFWVGSSSRMADLKNVTISL